jgi:NAD(P)-dependent dehydrogenase (short-subunit alcohol dehydrogenase family)
LGQAARAIGYEELGMLTRCSVKLDRFTVPGVVYAQSVVAGQDFRCCSAAGTPATACEVVDAILFLTDATFTTGEILHVDGGAHAGKW